MDGHELSEAVGAFGIFACVTTVITVSIWQFAISRRARATLVREEEYRKLAEQGAATQLATERQLAEIGEGLAEVKTRMATLEHILQAVE